MRGWLLVLAPLCAAWQGAGEGTVEWAAGRDKDATAHAIVHAEAVSRQEPGQGLSLVVTLDLAEGDGVLTLLAGQPVADGQEVALPDDRVQVAYTEYDGDGNVRFSAARVASGRFRVETGVAAMGVRLSLDLVDAGDGPHAWRRLQDGDLSVLPADLPAPDDDSTVVVPRARQPVTDVGGCEGDTEGTWDDTDSAGPAGGSSDSGDSGCAGDDTSDAGSSGCAGDDTASSAGGSGCAGDGGSSGGSGCAGDDVGGDGCGVAGRAHLPHLRRSTTARLVDRAPWLAALLGLRFLRRRPLGLARQGRR